ncbi:MAG: FtsW/RodA/SpoVE family cell cycle protein [Chitinophagaceae bacterium]
MNSLKIFFKGDITIWLIVFLLGLISIIIIYSTTANLAYHNKKDTMLYLFKQFSLVLIGFFLMYWIHRQDYNIFARFAKVVFYFSILLVCSTYFIGIKVNDAARWIRLPGLGLTIQPSEFLKIALFIYLSKLLSLKQEVINDFKHGYRPLIIPIALTCFVIAPSNLSTALMIGGVSLIILFIGGARIRHLLLTILVACIPLLILIGFATVAHSNPTIEQKITKLARFGTWINRIENFMYEDTDVYDQAKQANIAIAKGGIVGNGPGNSEQKTFLPNPFSDYIFSIFIEEYGLWATFILVLIYLLFMFRSIAIFKKCKYSFGGFLVISISAGFVIQALLSMMVNVGYLPVTGVALPFLSLGGTSYLLTCFSIGIVLGVANKINNHRSLDKPDFIEFNNIKNDYREEDEVIINSQMQKL